MKSIVLIGLVLAICAWSTLGKQIIDWKNLPDAPIKDIDPTVKMYAGTLGVGPEKRKKLHYTFLESRGTPLRDPLVVWMNGGPGCSSMYGFFYEHGYLRFHAGGRGLLVNDGYTFNNIANVLYLDIPAGVGYSYSKDKSDNMVNDETVAADGAEAIAAFLEDFAEFRYADLYIAGDGYAGTMAAYIAVAIDHYNEIADADKIINLQGVIAGNPSVLWDIEEMAWYDSLYEKNIYGKDLRELIEKYCLTNPFSFDCIAATERLEGYMRGISEYNINGPCFQKSANGENDYFKAKKMFADYNLAKNNTSISARLLKKLGSYTDPCLDVSSMTSYLRDERTRAALYVDKDAPLDWNFCSTSLIYLPNFVNGSYLQYNYLLSNGYHVFIYSGDQDTHIPTVSSQRWIRKYQRDFNLRASSQYEEWWMDGNQPEEPQVGGYTQTFGKFLTFATVRGAGHFVAQDQPKEFYELMKRWLHEETL